MKPALSFTMALTSIFSNRARFAALLLLLPSWSGSSCFGQCCGGPDTLFDWNGSTAAKDDSSDSTSPLSEPLQTDRPGFGDCPTTVGCGICQLELGYQYTYNHDGNASQIDHSYPQSLLRIGALANWFELRIGWSMEQETDRIFGVSSQTAVGSDDMNVGFKIALTPQDECRPQMGLVVDMSVPSGSSAFTAGEVLPEVEWIYQWALTKKLSVVGRTFLTCAVDGGTGDPYLEFSQAIETDFQITEEIGSYVEWHTSTPDGADTDRTQQVFEGGYTLLLNKNLQLDAEAGVGLNDATPDYFIGTGICYRRGRY
jgi:Putative MetA-pathway of phenol degradation